MIYNTPLLLQYYISTTVSPKAIGFSYLGLAVLFGALGTVYSNLVRLDAYSNGEVVIANSNIATYNLLITVHGIVMVFWFIMPTLFGGLGNITIPQCLGVSDVSYPRFNNISLILLPTSIIIVVVGLVTEYVAGPGWTLYAPLSIVGSTVCYQGLVLVLLGLIIVGNSSTLTSMNFLVTAMLQKVIGSNYSTIPIIVSSMVVTGILLLLVLPVLLCLILFVLSDISYNTSYFDPVYGGDPLFFQHLFWIFGHPEVYIIILPAFGTITLVFSYTITTYGNLSMVLAIVGIAVLGSVVWAHHMFAATISLDSKAYFTIVTLMIALPTGTKVANWCTTYNRY